MELVESRQTGATLPDAGIDGCDMERCFARLVDGEGGFSVACGEGYLRRLYSYVKQHYIYVKAAGGLVRNSDGTMLMMIRNGRCDLPKGKVEEGETLAQAALRETEEETGIKDLKIGALRLKTYHIYNLYGGWHFKQTSWFDMMHTREEGVDKPSSIQQFVPQLEEGITDVGWYNKEEWCKKLSNSYSTMKIITTQMIDSQQRMRIG